MKLLWVSPQCIRIQRISTIHWLFAVLVGLKLSLLAQPAPGNLPVLTQAKAVRELSADEAARGLPVRLRGVVTYFNPGRPSLFIQDATAGVYVDPSEDSFDLKLGGLVEVDGVSYPGRFAPMVVKPRLRIIGESSLPVPVLTSLDSLVSGRFDSQWVETRGVVRAATNIAGEIQIDLADGGARTRIWLSGSDRNGSLTNFIDAEILLQGVSGTHFDESRKLVGFHLFVQSPEQIKMEKPPPAEPFAVPVRPISQLLRFIPAAGENHRVKVEGVVTLQRPGRLLFIQDQTGPLMIETRLRETVQSGDKVEVLGFPALADPALVLQDAIFRRVGATNPPVPVAISDEQALQPENHGKLVRIQGTLLDTTVRPEAKALVLQGRTVKFPAFLGDMANLEHLAEGSLLELTGICLQDTRSAQPGDTFRILLRSLADISVVKRPSWWTLRHSLGVMGGLSSVIVAVSAWVVLLQRRVQEQTKTIRARLEAEAALDLRYHELFENATDMVYTHDLEGRFRSVNKAVQRILSYTQEELLALDVFHVVAPEYRDLSREMFQRKIREGGQTTYELELNTKDGRRVCGEVSSRLILQDGRPVGVHGVIRDLTERRKADLRSAALANLGYRLSAARSPKQAARIIIELADQLLGWHACYLHLFTSDQKALIPVVHIDTVAGDRVEVSAGYVDLKPSAMDLEILTRGKKLILRDQPTFGAASPLIPFGDKNRPSASLMFVPIRNGPEVIGVLSIQSYTAQAYTEADLETLQGLADHCGGALERIRTAQALEESEKHFRALIENSSDGISIVAANGLVLFASPSVTRILGYSAEEDVGSNAFERIHPDDQPSARARFFKLLSQPGATVTAQFRTRHKDGTWRWVEGTGKNLLQDASVGGMVLNYRDVTDRKLAERALQESEEKFRKVFEATPVSISISTLAEGRVEDVNDGFLQLFGFSREEVIGRTAAELGTWLNLEERAEIIRLLRVQSPVRNRECRLRTKTVEILDTLVSAEIIDFGNEPCVLIITYDMSERVRLELQLRHSQKMDAVGQLAAGIAHDFNNIMTIIQGHASLLLSASGCAEESAEALKKVLVAVERAAGLTRQLLTFSRKQVMQAKLLDLNQVISSISSMLHRLLGENVVLGCRSAPVLPAIYADAGMVEQIILNLAVNARDAMPKGGQLMIATSLIELDATAAQRHAEARPGRFVRLSVSDTGCGIDEAILDKIFEPFFTTKEVGKGTGLGLSTVYGIMKQHRGWIEVTSEVGRGTTFDLFFPAQSKPVDPPTPVADQPAPSVGTETVLVVEDEPALRHLVGHLLQRQGYSVLEAGSGKEALDLWRTHQSRIDLLLTDLVMPDGISGVDLAEHFQSEKPSLRIIYTSGYSQDVVGRRVDLEERVNFLPKPYHPPELAQIIRQCLDSARHG